MAVPASSPEIAVHPCKIFVGNLPFSLSQEGLAGLFRPFGTIVGVKLVTDRGTGKKKGFGFVTFDSPDCVDEAIRQMDGQDCGGRRLTVKTAALRGEKAGAMEEDDEDCEEPGVQEGGQEKGAAGEDGAWESAAPRRKGQRKAESFKARAQAAEKVGKVLGWGAGDDDWA